MSTHDAMAPRDRTWHPKALSTDYKSSVLRAPKRALFCLPPGPGELTGPVFGHDMLGEDDDNLITNFAHGAEALGERIMVHGQILDERGRSLPDVLIEIWQANAGGRYRHVRDGYLAPLDPNFSGYGRCMSDGQGHYAFKTVRPGPYPFPNRGCEWRPAHIHFSIFGTAFAQRLVTQVYFEGDPLIGLCPIVNSITQPAAIDKLVAKLDMSAMADFDYLAYRFDIVLRGASATPFEAGREAPSNG